MTDLTELSKLIDQFIQDKPREIVRSESVVEGVNIEGVIIDRLPANRDNRGFLVELLTTRYDDIAPIVHVYQVHAEPGSYRGWVFHKWQHDRLHYTIGDFELRLFDVRPDSPSLGQFMKLRLGVDNPCRVTIPPFVAHSVRNLGTESASFINMPTRVFDPQNPDKFRYKGSMAENDLPYA